MHFPRSRAAGNRKALTREELRDFLSRMELLSEPVVLSAHSEGKTFEEALSLSRGRGLRLISSDFANRVLYQREGWLDNPSAWPVWTGTVVAFPPSGEPFREHVLWTSGGTSYAMDTKKYAGLKGSALVMESGAYDLLAPREGVRIFEPREKPRVVERFPQESRWCGLGPCGIPAENGKADVMLWRSSEERVIPVAADFYFFFDGRMKGYAFCLGSPPTRRLGALAFAMSESNYPAKISEMVGADERPEFISLLSEWVGSDPCLARAVLAKFSLLEDPRAPFAMSERMIGLKRAAASTSPG